MDSPTSLRPPVNAAPPPRLILQNPIPPPRFPPFQQPPPIVPPGNFPFPSPPPPGMMPHMPVNFSLPPPGWIAPSGVSNEQADVWIEQKSPEGKCYYYNSRTRETTWVRPTDSTVVSQNDVQKPESINDNKEQSADKKETDEDKAKEGDGSSKVLENHTSESNGSPAPVELKQPTFLVPPPILPIPPNFPGFQPPPWLTAVQPDKALPTKPWPVEQPPPTQNIQEEIGKLEEKKKEQQSTVDRLKQEASEWTKHTSPEGREYFYSSRAMHSQWTKPKAMEDLEVAESSLKETETNLSALRGKLGVETAASIAAEIPKIQPEPPKVEKPTEEELARQRNRPISNIPVSGSPWCVVWTGNGRVFFYNPAQKLSVWERPSELQGRSDVDKMVSEPPAEVQSLLTVKRKAVEDAKDEVVKKAKPDVEDGKIEEEGGTVIEAGKEAALEAEQKAAKERNQIPYEIRAAQFRGMLLEKGVSAFSTWEKELHKIVFDRRYLLLVSKERKAVFDKFVKERAEEERLEKAVKLRKIKDDFKELLKETVTRASTIFSEFAAKNSKDERYRAVEKMREREMIFSEHISRLKRKEREDRYNDLERLRRNFWDLLRERNIGDNSRWLDVKRSLESDPRYKAVESTSRREDWFREYVREHRRSPRPETDEKQARIDASIRKRQEEVKEQLSGSLREREKEREQLRKTEATENFQVLLMDMVRQTDVDWKQTKRSLRKDCRWDLCRLLGKEEKEKLFDQHICALNKKKRDAFYQLLDETEEVTLTSKWKSVKKIIKSDIRYERFSSSDRAREKEFAQFIREKYTKAKEEFRQLLEETKILTYKSLSAIKSSEQTLKDIEDVLSNDSRYLTLECVPEERKKILFDFLHELQSKGPPPPPTASEPSRRK